MEAQRDFHKIHGNLKVVTVPTPTTAPTSSNGSSFTMGGRQTSSADDDPRHHLFTVVVPRKTYRPQETNASDGRIPVTSDTTSSTNTVTWSTTSTATRFSTASDPSTTDMITRPTVPASKQIMISFMMLMFTSSLIFFFFELKKNDSRFAWLHARLD